MNQNCLLNDPFQNPSTTVPASSEKERILFEDALKHFHGCAFQGQKTSADSLAGALSLSRSAAGRLMARLEQAGLIEPRSGSYELTTVGTDYALQIIRAHRLYETYLARESGLKPAEWHRRAHIVEHRLHPQEVDDLADRLSRPRFDPHGDPIPTRSGRLAPREGCNLLEWPLAKMGEIEHIEDEPTATFHLVQTAGLYPTMRLLLEENSPQVVRLYCEGRHITLPRNAAAHITVKEPLPENQSRPFPTRLRDLPPGEKGLVAGLSPYFRGAERTRLLDLGFVQGSTIERVLTSPLQSPIAFLLRGAMVALREEQAEHVYLQPSSASV